MSVSVEYIGRLGNNLFQYTLARMYAEDHGLELITGWKYDKEFPATQPPSGFRLNQERNVISNGNYEESKDIRQTAYFRDYFQKSRWYKPHRDRIKSYFNLPVVQKNTEDIVMHIRADDYARDTVIHPNWYKKILKQECFRRLYIVMSPLETQLLDHFKELNPTIISSSMRDDFLFIRNFDKIICSNSSFCWWAAFLGNPSKVYTFSRWCKSSDIELSDLPNAVEIDGPYLEHDPMQFED